MTPIASTQPPTPSGTAGAEAVGALRDGCWIKVADQAPPRMGLFLGIVDGYVRAMNWGKASHVPFYGYCLADQGVEEFEIAHPAHWTHWMPIPPRPTPTEGTNLSPGAAEQDKHE